MADFTYTTVPGKIKPLFAKIREVGIPQKVTIQWLKSMGYKSSNDGTLIGVLRASGLVDNSGVPTSVWGQYRGAKHMQVLAASLRQGYAELFAFYPDANARPNADLEHVFSTSSSGGKQVISKAVSTFKALVELGDFSADAAPTDLQLPAGPLHTPPAPNHAPPAAPVGSIPAVHIDIQVHISAEAGADQIENIFRSMAKHLYGRKDTE